MLQSQNSNKEETTCTTVVDRHQGPLILATEGGVPGAIPGSSLSAACTAPEYQTMAVCSATPPLIVARKALECV
jgi:hypothetical protein